MQQWWRGASAARPSHPASTRVPLKRKQRLVHCRSPASWAQAAAAACAAHPSAQAWAAAARSASQTRLPVSWWRARFSLCAWTAAIWFSLGGAGGDGGAGGGGAGGCRQCIRLRRDPRIPCQFQHVNIFLPLQYFCRQSLAWWSQLISRHRLHGSWACSTRHLGHLRWRR